MQWPALRDWIFALKTFIAALLALYIAEPRPRAAVLGDGHGLHRLSASVRRHALQGSVPAVRYTGGRIGRDHPGADAGQCASAPVHGSRTMGCRLPVPVAARPDAA